MESAKYRQHVFIYCSLILALALQHVPATQALSKGSQEGVELKNIVHYHDSHEVKELVQILSDMGYNSLATHMLSSDVLVGWKGSVTLLAPTDEAYRNSTTPSLLPHHILKGLFTSRDLSMLPQGTRLDTIANNGRCVVITSDGNSQVYVNGIPVSHPDLFNDGLLAIHGIDRFLETAPPVQPQSDRDASSTGKPVIIGSPAAAPAPVNPAPPAVIMPFMLKDAAFSLRDRGYSILALALRLKAAELLGLKSLTIFAVDDDSIFAGGQEFVNNVRYHVVPNKRLLLADLMALPGDTRLDTLLEGQSLLVTNTNPFSINNVQLKNPNAFSNAWIAVHSIAQPFPRSDQTWSHLAAVNKEL